MSTRPGHATRQSGPARADAPLLGALLRIAHEAFTSAMLEHLRTKGIDLSVTDYRVLRYPGPDGVRPIELAERCNLTRQAMNYTLAGLEGRGLIERRAAPGRKARLVYATPRGWEVFHALRASVAAVERDWTTRFGARRLADLHTALHDIAVGLAKVDAPVASLKPGVRPRARTALQKGK